MTLPHVSIERAVAPTLLRRGERPDPRGDDGDLRSDWGLRGRPLDDRRTDLEPASIATLLPSHRLPELWLSPVREKTMSFGDRARRKAAERPKSAILSVRSSSAPSTDGVLFGSFLAGFVWMRRF